MNTAELPPNVVEIADGVYEIDTLLGGWEKVTAGYLINAKFPILIEPGSQSSKEALFATLAQMGVNDKDLAYGAVTHIHLDHAGGIGDIAANFSTAKILVHPKGARHLVDPSKLIASASTVYGPLLDSLYGRLTPTDQSRIEVLEDGHRIDLGDGRYLEVIDSPGHAKHHLAMVDSHTGLLFAGDAVGVRLPDNAILRPSSPPADFDLQQAINSLSKFKEAKAHRIALAHYGLVNVNPDELLDEAIETLNAWADVAKRAFLNGEDIAKALKEAFIDDNDIDDSSRLKLETLNGIHSNAAGLKLYFEKVLGQKNDHGK